MAVDRVGNFRQKNNSEEDGIDGTNGYFRRNSGCSAEQKISEFCSEPFLGIPFRGTKTEALIICSEPFCGREHNSEFRSVEPKQMQFLGIPFLTIPRKRTQLGNPFRATKNRNKLSKCPSEPFRGRETNLEQVGFGRACAPCAARTRRFGLIPFRSVPSFGIGSSAELGMPRNECFLPRNNGNRSESIPRNFFGTKFRSQP
jgi:hypothetical protein